MNLMPAFVRRRISHRPNLVKIVDNVGWLFLDKIVRLGLGLFVGVWLARYLGPEQFGLIGYATALVGLFGVLATLGLGSIVVRDLVRDPENAYVTLGTAAALQLIGGLVAFALAALAVQFLRPDDALARMAVVILGSALVFRASMTANFWFEAQVLSKYTVWINNAVFLVLAAVKITLILLGAPLLAFVWVMFAESAIVALGMIVIFAARGVDLRKLRVRLDRGVAMLRDAWPLMFAGIAIAVYMKIDMIMLGQMRGDEAVGIYSAAVRISEVWYFIPMAIVASVFPAILEAKRKSEALYYQRLQQLYDLMVIMAVAVAIPMTFLSGWVVTLLFGAAYAEAGPVLAVHIWASVFVFLGVASGKWFIAENRQMLSLQRTTLGAIANVALNLVLIPKFGAIGAAWATVIAYSIAAFLFDVVQIETRRMFAMKLMSFNVVAAVDRMRSTSGQM